MSKFQVRVTAQLAVMPTVEQLQPTRDLLDTILRPIPYDLSVKADLFGAVQLVLLYGWDEELTDAHVNTVTEQVHTLDPGAKVNFVATVQPIQPVTDPPAGPGSTDTPPAADQAENEG
jgi:hypothetical protein